MLSDFLQPGLILIISGLLLLLLPAALRRAVQIAGPLLTLAAVLFVLGGAPESAPPVKGLPKERRHGVSRGGRRAGEGQGPVP